MLPSPGNQFPISPPFPHPIIPFPLLLFLTNITMFFFCKLLLVKVRIFVVVVNLTLSQGHMEGRNLN